MTIEAFVFGAIFEMCITYLILCELLSHEKNIILTKNDVFFIISRLIG